MNTLYIDTRDNNQIIVRLEKDEEIFEEKSVANKDRSQAALPTIEKVLKDSNLKIHDLDEIKVETGPGSYTGLRVGIAIANALSLGSSVTINGKPLGEIELPQY